jgi:integrase
MSGDVLPCLADPLATAGFGTLQRMRPVKARAMLLEVLPVPVDLTTGPTVEATLRSGHRQRALLERRAALSTVQAHRHAARHLARASGSRLLARIDDGYVSEVGRVLVRRGMAASTRGRVLSLLRGLHREWAAATGEPCLVSATPRPGRSMDPAPSVLPMWRLPEVAVLLGAVRSPAVRAVVGLVVGGGLHPGEALSLRRDHVRPGLRSVVVRGGVGMREVGLPRWTGALLEAALRDATAGASPWAFPSPRDPASHRRAVNAVLQRVQSSQGSLGQLAPAGLQVLRRTWLWWARHAGAPAPMRTGRWTLGADGVLPPWWSRGQRLLGAWKIMVVPEPKARFQLRAEGVLRRSRGAWWPGEWVAYQEAVRRSPPVLPREVWGAAGRR